MSQQDIQQPNELDNEPILKQNKEQASHHIEDDEEEEEVLQDLQTLPPEQQHQQIQQIIQETFNQICSEDINEQQQEKHQEEINPPKALEQIQLEEKQHFHQEMTNHDHSNPELNNQQIESEKKNGHVSLNEQEKQFPVMDKNQFPQKEELKIDQPNKSENTPKRASEDLNKKLFSPKSEQTDQFQQNFNIEKQQFTQEASLNNYQNVEQPRESTEFERNVLNPNTDQEKNMPVIIEKNQFPEILDIPADLKHQSNIMAIKTSQQTENLLREEQTKYDQQEEIAKNEVPIEASQLSTQKIDIQEQFNQKSIPKEFDQKQEEELKQVDQVETLRAQLHQIKKEGNKLQKQMKFDDALKKYKEGIEQTNPENFKQCPKEVFDEIIDLRKGYFSHIATLCLSIGDTDQCKNYANEVIFVAFDYRSQNQIQTMQKLIVDQDQLNKSQEILKRLQNIYKELQNQILTISISVKKQNQYNPQCQKKTYLKQARQQIHNSKLIRPNQIDIKVQKINVKFYLLVGGIAMAAVLAINQKKFSHLPFLRSILSAKK